MALDEVASPMKMKYEVINGYGEEVIGVEFVRYTRSFSLGRKRILITTPNNDSVSSPFNTPLKRRCSDIAMNLENSEKSVLECLPQHLLVRVLCGVDHEDLKHLFHVSKAIREATLVAKKSHFAYSTPRKRTAFRNPTDLENQSDVEEVDAPNAPNRSRQKSFMSRLNQKDKADLSVALFS